MILPDLDWHAIAQHPSVLAGLRTLARITLYTGLTFALFYALELWQGADMRRYWTKAAFNDALYRVFYLSGLVSVLIYAPLAAALRPYLPWTIPPVFTTLPLPVGIVVGFLVQDFAAYWYHRFQHSRVWWRFHRLHHSAEELTFLTVNRAHPVDILMGEQFSVMLAMLGAPPALWLPYRLVSAFLIASFHSALPWHYGPLAKVIVSPVFHAVHHSRDAAHYNRNFGSVLAIWDVMFGTAVLTTTRPTRFGLDDYEAPESIPLQLVEPVWGLFRPFVTPRTRASAAAPVAAPDHASPPS